MGAVNKAIRPGDPVIPADIIELTQTPFSLLPGRQSFDASGKRLICREASAVLAELAAESWPAGLRVHGQDQDLVIGHMYGPRLTSPAEAMAMRSMGADVLNHSVAPEATLSREIGACFVPVSYVTAGFSDYMDRSDGQLLKGDVLPRLSRLSSELALHLASRLLGRTVCCAGLLSPQPCERAARF